MAGGENLENEEKDKGALNQAPAPERPHQPVKRGLARPADAPPEAPAPALSEPPAARRPAVAAETAPARRPASPARQAARLKLPELSAQPSGPSLLRPELFGHIPVKVTVELGEAAINLKEVLDLAEGSVIELERLAGQPLDLKIKDQLIARGEVVVIDDAYGLRITEIVGGE